MPERLLLRAQNLGVLRWGVWSARTRPGSILDDCVDPNVRCLVVDLGSLGTREEQALVAEAVLARLWERRTDRTPVLIVIDEAHNVCPQEAEDPLTALATEHADANRRRRDGSSGSTSSSPHSGRRRCTRTCSPSATTSSSCA